MENVQLLLYVENESDAILVKQLLKTAHYPIEHIEILPSNGKKNLAHFLKKAWKLKEVKYAALVNFDSMTVSDAMEQAKKCLGNPETQIFCAVPTIEAWLFADIEAAKRKVYSEHGRRLLNRVSLPEEIPHPRRLAYSVFRQQKVEQYASVFENVNIEIAASRSPSLRIFLEGIGEILNLEKIPTANTYFRHINRDVISNLLSEVSSTNAVIYRTIEGTSITAEEMIRLLREGSPLGQQYAMDILRTAKDIITQKADAQQVSQYSRRKFFEEKP
ncbi:MAG: DUF4276 family protein [Thiomargarita sp.]|nr:DUF4276 family protein [Thiomargarita sp.]